MNLDILNVADKKTALEQKIQEQQREIDRLNREGEIMLNYFQSFVMVLKELHRNDLLFSEKAKEKLANCDNRPFATGRTPTQPKINNQLKCRPKRQKGENAMDTEKRIEALERKIAALEAEAQKQPVFDKMKFLETAKSLSPLIWHWDEDSTYRDPFIVIAESLSRTLMGDRPA